MKAASNLVSRRKDGRGKSAGGELDYEGSLTERAIPGMRRAIRAGPGAQISAEQKEADIARTLLQNQGGARRADEGAGRVSIYHVTANVPQRVPEGMIRAGSGAQVSEAQWEADMANTLGRIDA